MAVLTLPKATQSNASMRPLGRSISGSNQSQALGTTNSNEHLEYVIIDENCIGTTRMVFLWRAAAVCLEFG